MPKDTNKRTARQKDADELHTTSHLADPSIDLLTLIEGNTSSIDTTLDISLSVFRDAILGANTKDFSTIQTVLDSIKDTDGIKKITDAVTLNSLPTGDNIIGRIKVTDGTDILLIDGSGRITVVQAEKDRTISGNVGLLTSGDVRINPAKEDGNLASIKAKTDNLDITTSSFRDDIRGANTKDFSTIQTVLDSIKDTDGIKKITDAVTVIQPNPALLTGTVTQAAKDRTITSGNITTHKGDTDYDKVKKTGFYTTQQSDQPLWTPAAGKKFVITDIIVSVDTAMRVYLNDDAEKMWQWNFAANGGAVINLQTPDESAAADNVLSITMDAAGICSIKVLGWEE